MFIRRLPEFDYHAPASVADALDQLSRYGEKCRVFAGGTDVLIAMKKREVVPEHFISLKGIEDLKGIHHSELEGLKIGGAVTIGDLERSEVVKGQFPVLWDAVKVMAAPPVRNLGTIGGNLCSAAPSADTAPPLIALGASVKLVSTGGERTVLVEDFFAGPGKSVLKPDEILTEVLIPNPPQDSGGAYMKLMRRSAMDLALVGVAAQVRLDRDTKVCKEIRIALGAVAPTPMRASKAESILIEKEINEKSAAEAAEVASQEALPITDVRATKEYRTEMIKVLTKRVVEKAGRRIEENTN